MEENLKRTGNKGGCAAEVVKCRMKCHSDEGERSNTALEYGEEKKCLLVMRST